MNRLSSFVPSVCATSRRFVLCAARQSSGVRAYHMTQPLQSHYSDPAAASKANARPPVTLLDIKKLWKKKVPIAVLTAHDYISAKIADASGVDMILVGDSLSMVALGYENTNEIELDVSMESLFFGVC